MIERGTFRVPAGTKGDVLERATYTAVKKFLEKLVKGGWRVRSRPVVRKVQVAATEEFRVVESRGLSIWIPNSTKMRPDHPWNVPGEDLYEVGVYVTRAPRQVKMWVPDWYVEKRGLPAGMKSLE